MSATLACTYDLPRGLGGNRGARATVLNQLRARPHTDGTQISVVLNASPSPDTQSTTLAAPGTLSNYDFNAYIDVYLDQIYPAVPLLGSTLLRNQASQVDTSPISRQFILAFCAYVVNFGKLSDISKYPSPISINDESGKHHLDAAMSVQDLRRVTKPNPLSVYTSFFLYGAWAGQGNYDQAWYYLREATTLFTILKPQFDENYDEEAHRRLFWVMLISERYVPPRWSYTMHTYDA